MKKFRLYFDKDQETAWLNEMAANVSVPRIPDFPSEKGQRPLPNG